jgi:hypothetical protein
VLKSYIYLSPNLIIGDLPLTSAKSRDKKCFKLQQFLILNTLMSLMNACEDRYVLNIGLWHCAHTEEVDSWVMRGHYPLWLFVYQSGKARSNVVVAKCHFVQVSLKPDDWLNVAVAK